MNLWFYCLSELNFEDLMAVYEESNTQKGESLSPYESANGQRSLAEQEFADYLREIFFRQEGAAYYVCEENGSYISAVRIEPFDDGYLISALETRKEFRNRGYGKHLLQSLIQECEHNGKLPIYSHIHSSNKASMHLHLSCGFSVYRNSARYLDGSVCANSKTLIYK